MMRELLHFFAVLVIAAFCGSLGYLLGGLAYRGEDAPTAQVAGACIGTVLALAGAVVINSRRWGRA
jgi:hypothetical protein